MVQGEDCHSIDIMFPLICAFSYKGTENMEDEEWTKGSRLRLASYTSSTASLPSLVHCIL